MQIPNLRWSIVLTESHCWIAVSKASLHRRILEICAHGAKRGSTGAFDAENTLDRVCFQLHFGHPPKTWPRQIWGTQRAARSATNAERTGTARMKRCGARTVSRRSQRFLQARRTFKASIEPHPTPHAHVLHSFLPQHSDIPSLRCSIANPNVAAHLTSWNRPSPNALSASSSVRYKISCASPSPVPA